jgi:hypothetical protein
MKLHLEWEQRITLQYKPDGNFIFACNLDEVPDAPGIYIFGREHGDNFEAIYVGQAISIRVRIKQQFNNLSLMRHIENAKAGAKIIQAGIFVAKKGQQLAKSLDIVEGALIRHFLYEGHELVNIKGRRLIQHEISSGGKFRPINQTIFVDQ